jgi:hypothetical protein
MREQNDLAALVGDFCRRRNAFVRVASVAGRLRSEKDKRATTRLPATSASSSVRSSFAHRLLPS